MSRLSGFSPELLRAWENRHHLLSPARGPGGQRLYSDEDLAILGRVRQLLDEGRSIGEIAASGRRALLMSITPPPTTAAPLLAAPASSAKPPEEQPEHTGTTLVQAMLRQARLELTLGWALDGSGESVAARSMHSASQAMGRLAQRLDPAQVLEGVVETLADDFDSALARVWVFDPAENALHLRASAGLSRRTTTSSRARIDLARYRYKVGVVARTREPFVSNAIVGDSDFDQRWVRRERLVSVAILPLATGGNLQGILASFFRVAVSEDVVGALGIFAATAAAAIAARRSSARNERLSA